MYPLMATELAHIHEQELMRDALMARAARRERVGALRLTTARVLRRLADAADRCTDRAQAPAPRGVRAAAPACD